MNSNMFLFASGMARRLVPRLPGLPQGKRYLATVASLLAVLLLALLPGAPPAQALQFFVVTISPTTPVVAGTRVSFQVSVMSTSNADVDFTISPHFHGGSATLVEFTQPGYGSCTQVGNNVNCNIGVMYPSDTAGIGVTYDLASSYVQTGGDQLSIEVDLHDDESDSDYDYSAAFGVTSSADLAVTKLGKPDYTVRAGETISYTIFVDNFGPSDARNVVVEDDILSSEAFSLVGGPVAPGYSCTTTGTGAERKIVCTRTSPIPAGARDVINIAVTSNETSTIDNTVLVTSIDPDPAMYNNTAHIFTSVTDVADLEVTKTLFSVSPPGTDATAGGTITYTILVTNTGPSEAENVVLVDTLPGFIRDNVTFPLVPFGASCTPGTPPTTPAICNLGNIPDGESRMIRIRFELNPSYPIDPLLGASIQNEVLVLSDIFDPDNGNNRASVETEVVASADLAITKTDDPETVIAGDLPEALGGVIDGDLLKYTITVTNTGPSDALSVVVTDTLPVDADGEPQVVFLYSTLTDFVGADQCSADPIHPEEVTCEVGTMTVSQTISFDILTFVNPDVVQAGEAFHTITNTAQVQSPTTDPVPDNNQVTQDTRVEAKADLIITKTDSPDPVVAGEQVVYTISFVNQGPSTARRVAILDQLPPKFQAIDVDGDPANGIDPCMPIDPDDVVTCIVTDTVAGQIVALTELKVRGTTELPGDLDPDEGYGFAIVAEVESAYVLDKGAADFEEPLTNPTNPISDTVYIDSETTSDTGGFHPDINPDDNQDSELTFVTAQADLKISKTDTPDPGLPDSYLYYDPVTGGFVYTYTLTIENLGSSDAAKVVLYDWVPPDATFRLPPGATGSQIFTPTNDIQCMFRDDGLLLCLVGNDPNNDAIPQRGRLNASSVLSMTFSVEVDPSPTPRELTNTAWVVAVAEDEFPFALGDTSDDPIEPTDFLTDTTPTADPNLDNNTFTETTTVLTGRVEVDKKAYVNHSEARGIDIPTDPIYGTLTEAERCAVLAQDDILVLPGDEIVYCYTITNPGETWLRSITLQDAPNGFEWLNPSNYEVVYPDQPPLRGTITLDPAAPAINQTINISQTHNAKAVLAPAGVEDDYAAIVITRKVTVDFPELGPISGVVWEDNNGNGVVDLIYEPPPNEVQPEPLSPAGVDVYLLNEAGTDIVDFTTTDADGRYVFHNVDPGRYTVRVEGGVRSEMFEYDPSRGYSTANFDTVEDRWYIESNLPWIDTTFRVLGNNRAGVRALPSTKYSTEYPGVPFVFNSDLLNDTLGLAVLEDTDPQWEIYEDNDGDGLPSPGDVVEYTADIPNSGAIEATGVRYYDGLYNWIADDNTDLRVPGILINGSVSAALHVRGRDLATGREIDADVQPPDLAFGEDLLLRTQAPGIDLTYDSAIVLDEEIVLGNNEGDDEVFVWTRLAIPPKGWLLRFNGVTYDPPIPVTFSLRVKYRVRIKETKYVRLGTIVLNHPWVTYNEIGVFDQRFPNFDPTDPDKYTAANRVFNNHAGTPYRAWESPEFPGWPPIPEDVEPTNYLGDRFDDYALPGAPIRDDDDPTWFKLVREPRRIQLPAIDHKNGWDTRIQVQNGGDDNTGAVVFFWGEYSGLCPYSDPGPMGYACKWVALNGVWSLKDQIIPSTAKSAVVYSVDEALFDEACADAAIVVADPNPYLDPRPRSRKWRDWEDGYTDLQGRYHEAYEGTGEPIAVIVQREGPNDHGTLVSSAYPGISENNVGGGPEYKYFAPYAMRHYHDLDTEIIIHNSGERCTEVWLEYQKQGDDFFSHEDSIAQLAPGESVRKRVPAALGGEWLGSVYITADEPLGIVVDQSSFLPSEDRGTLLTYEARPYRLTTDTLFYADLVWRELSGWEASIQVQNLTQHSQPTFVTVEFFDQSGDSILFLGDWVPRAGGKTFYLPAVTDLGVNYPAGYVGAAEIQSHAQVDYPGGVHDGQPIFAVVDLKKTKVYDESLPGWRHTIAGERQGGAYNALAEGEKKEASAFLLPYLSKAKNGQGVTSLIAVRNNANCNAIALELEVRKGSGTMITYVTDFWLSPRHIKIIDLANVGTVNPGFGGAGIVKVKDVEQLCDVNRDGHMDQEPTMLSVVVVNKGTGPGDVTAVYEGVPVAYWGSP